MYELSSVPDSEAVKQLFSRNVHSVIPGTRLSLQKYRYEFVICFLHGRFEILSQCECNEAPYISKWGENKYVV